MQSTGGRETVHPCMVMRYFVEDGSLQAAPGLHWQVDTDQGVLTTQVLPFWGVYLGSRWQEGTVLSDIGSHEAVWPG